MLRVLVSGGRSPLFESKFALTFLVVLFFLFTLGNAWAEGGFEKASERGAAKACDGGYACFSGGPGKFISALIDESCAVLSRVECPDGCNNATGKCIVKRPVCQSGWVCEDSKTLGYKKTDCSFDMSLPCKTGESCSAGVCVLDSTAKPLVSYSFNGDFADSSGNNYNLVTQGMPKTVNEGVDGESAGFDGSSYLSGSSFRWSSRGPVTVMFWMKPRDLRNAMAFSVGNSANRFLAAPWSDGVFYWDYGNYASGRVSADYKPFLNKWVHVALVSAGINGAYKAIYINGNLVADGKSSLGPATPLNGLTIGRGSDGSKTYYYSGLLDEFSVYNSVLSPEAIKKSYDAQKARLVECFPHSKAMCSGDNVHWFDSCNQVEELKESCSDGTCFEGKCYEKNANKPPLCFIERVDYKPEDKTSEVTFVVSGSDPEKKTLKLIELNFGDNSSVGIHEPTENRQSFTHVYGGQQTSYTATLKVTDSGGLEAVCTFPLYFKGTCQSGWFCSSSDTLAYMNANCNVSLAQTCANRCNGEQKQCNPEPDKCVPKYECNSPEKSEYTNENCLVTVQTCTNTKTCSQQTGKCEEKTQIQPPQNEKPEPGLAPNPPQNDPPVSQPNPPPQSNPVLAQGCTFKQGITINSGKSFSDFTARVEVGEGRQDFWGVVQPDGRDVRFADTAGNVLGYWTERFDYKGKYAIFHVKTNLSAGNNKIYLYTGSGSLASASSFDDLSFVTVTDGGSVEYWGSDKDSGSPWVSANGVLYNNSTSGSQSAFTSPSEAFALSPVTFFKFKAKRTGNAELAVMPYDSKGPVMYFNGSGQGYFGVPGNPPCVTGLAISDYLYDEFIASRGTNFSWNVYKNGEYKGSCKDQSEHYGVNSRVSHAGNGGVFIDYIYVRKSGQSEPTGTFSGDAEKITNDNGICAQHATIACSQNNLYWFSTSGQQNGLKQNCGVNQCSPYGNSYCKNGNVYKSKTCEESTCANNTCQTNPVFEDTLVQDCAGLGCTDGACNPCTGPKCPEQNPIIPPGHEHYCRDKKCAEGQGDCDYSTDCQEGLICAEDVGPKYGFSQKTDVCEKNSGSVELQPEPKPIGECVGKLGLNNDELVCKEMKPGDWGYCTPKRRCNVGEGDCNTNDDCKQGLICLQRVDPNTGINLIDYCVNPLDVPKDSDKDGWTDDEEKLTWTNPNDSKDNPCEKLSIFKGPLQEADSTEFWINAIDTLIRGQSGVAKKSLQHHQQIQANMLGFLYGAWEGANASAKSDAEAIIGIFDLIGFAAKVTTDQETKTETTIALLAFFSDSWATECHLSKSTTNAIASTPSTYFNEIVPDLFKTADFKANENHFDGQDRETFNDRYFAGYHYGYLFHQLAALKGAGKAAKISKESIMEFKLFKNLNNFTKVTKTLGELTKTYGRLPPNKTASLERAIRGLEAYDWTETQQKGLYTFIRELDDPQGDAIMASMKQTGVWTDDMIKQALQLSPDAKLKNLEVNPKLGVKELDAKATLSKNDYYFESSGLQNRITKDNIQNLKNKLDKEYVQFETIAAEKTDNTIVIIFEKGSDLTKNQLQAELEVLMKTHDAYKNLKRAFVFDNTSEEVVAKVLR